MAFSSSQVACTDTAAALTAPGRIASVNDPVLYIVVNGDAANTIYLGGSDVTSSNGFPLSPGAVATLSIIDNTPPYAVCASSLTATAGILIH